MQYENQNNSEHGHFLLSENLHVTKEFFYELVY